MSLLVLSDTQDRVSSSLTQDNIDEAEEWLASLVGPLVGERTETFFLSERNDWRLIDGLFLRRKTNAVILTNDGTQLTNGTDFRLLDNILIERIPNGATWGDTMAATYDPNDEEVIRSVLYDLLTYRQTPSGTQSIRIGSYSESYFPSGQGTVVQDALVRRVLPASGMGPYATPFRLTSTRRDRTLITGGGS